MASIGSGYDYSPHIISPEGKNFQVQYARKAVERRGTILGIRCKDGVVLAAEHILHSPLLVQGSSSHIHTVEKNYGFAATGRMADSRQLSDYATNQVQEWENATDTSMPTKVLANRVSLNMQVYTMYSGYRPLGVGLLIAGWNPTEGAQLWGTDPSGTLRGYFAHSYGKASLAAKNELEKLDLTNLSVEDAVKAAARIIYQVHDSLKDRNFDLELTWVTKDTNGVHQKVPENLRKVAIQAAEAAIQSEMDLSDSDSDDSDDDV